MHFTESQYVVRSVVETDSVPPHGISIKIITELESGKFLVDVLVEPETLYFYKEAFRLAEKAN